MERIHDLAAHSPDDFLANPINAYLLVKRLTVDWADLQDVMTDNSMGKGAAPCYLECLIFYIFIYLLCVCAYFISISILFIQILCVHICMKLC